jgi:hypothetical protein
MLLLLIHWEVLRQSIVVADHFTARESSQAPGFALLPSLRVLTGMHMACQDDDLPLLYCVPLGNVQGCLFCI